MVLEENKPLAPFTTFGIGGPARWFAEAASEDDIVECAAWARARSLPLFVLGGGSNLLVADAGFNGLVLRVGLRGIAVAEPARDSYPRIYRVAAGETWDGFVERAVEDNCAGIECLAGIPGTVGGTPVQNVGAYGQEVASVIERVRAFDLQERVFVEFSAAECGFAYRRSRFNSADRGRYVVTRVDYRLTYGGAPTLRYAELEQMLEPMRQGGREVSLAEVASAVRSIRHSKGMLLVEGDLDCRSAGSFFKNPVIAEEQLRRIAESSAKQPRRFTAGPEPENRGRVKVPAAWLIEQAGFAKGYALGRAAISSRHTLALVNRGGASAAEILALAGQIAAAVETRFGIQLEMEPVLLGF
ncbi:MAG: UDP-N-acetylmuramate dehydrogenase [Terracidiphilus sp.]|jgi:UDP-N-acetylmuramate dehydrogenase